MITAVCTGGHRQPVCRGRTLCRKPTPCRTAIHTACSNTVIATASDASLHRRGQHGLQVALPGVVPLLCLWLCLWL